MILKNLILAIICIGFLFSCSSSKGLKGTDQEKLIALKNDLNFSTSFNPEGLTVYIINNSDKIHQLSDMYVHVVQVQSEKSITTSLPEMVNSAISSSKEKLKLQIELRNLIESNFAGVEGDYSISVAYKSDRALSVHDARNLYFISYKYQME